MYYWFFLNKKYIFVYNLFCNFVKNICIELVFFLNYKLKWTPKLLIVILNAGQKRTQSFNEHYTSEISVKCKNSIEIT